MLVRHTLRGVLVILVVSLLAGCMAGNEPRGSKKASANTASTLLGDPRTLDPCAFTRAPMLTQFGQVSPAGTVSLDYCLQHVRTPDGSLVQVATGELNAFDPQRASGAPVVPRESFRVERQAPVPGHCARRIVFDDRIAMVVRVDQLSGRLGKSLCGMAEAGVEAALVAIERGTIEHRRYPENSLALRDPCGVLDSRWVRTIPGLEQANAQPSIARHECRWGQQAASTPRVRLVHTAGDPPRISHGFAVEEHIAGRRTVVSNVGGDPSVPLCFAETGHIPFESPEPGQREVAMLVVTLPGANGIQACEIARGLAQRAWPRLPASAAG